ncbi:methylsterol monooxygenase [Acrasis kona]|uniref:Methylsterol monooxygenase n=1 Tax=Acrasis kona TaxID=1008807 RepID=A0AAW2Z3Q7_9EUKA
MQTFWSHCCREYFYDSELLMFCILIVASFQISFWTLNAALIYLDTHKTRFDKYRIQSNKPKVSLQPELVSKIRKSIVKYTITASLFTPILYLLLNIKGRVDMRGPTPPITTIIWQTLLFIFTEDTLFYWGHYLLHHKSLYKFHKEHHTYQQPIGIVAVLSDPLESLIQIQSAVWIAAALLPHKHIFTLMVWIIIRVHQTVYAHGGYNIPYVHMKHYIPSLFLGCKPHDYHHRVGKYNYGSFFSFWDKVMGTYKEPDTE